MRCQGDCEFCTIDSLRSELECAELAIARAWDVARRSCPAPPPTGHAHFCLACSVLRALGDGAE